MHPFSDQPEQTIASLGEKQLLRSIRSWLGKSAPDSPFGMGDDCAEIPATELTRLITTDSVVLGRHFTPDTSPSLVGEKLLKRNLSDIAAMGGIPTRAVMAGFLPRTLKTAWLEACLRGLAACALDYGVDLVGGDLSESDHDLALNLTLLGRGSRFLYRHCGKPGDWICVTGLLGGSLLGRHLTFTPRLGEGRVLAGRAEIHACLDISDGLAIDLLNLLPEGLSAHIDPEAIPLHPDAHQAATASGKPALWHALNDGEDHELLFLADPMETEKWAAFERVFREQGLAPIRRIGELVEWKATAILNALTGKPFDSLQGHDHFR